MSFHPSFKSGKSKEHKSVLKRLEQLLHLRKADKWTEEDSVFGLPKVKVLKLKIKKEKKAAEVEEAAAGAVAGEAGVVGTEGAAAKPEEKAGGKKEADKKPGEKKGK